MAAPRLPDDEVRAVFGAGDATTCTVAQLYEPVASASVGIWCVTCGDDDAVLKLLAHDPAHAGNWPSSDEIDHWGYWRREADAYASGLLDRLAGGLRAPQCRLVRERDDGTIACWLEAVDGVPGNDWGVDAYAIAARRFGHAQGAFARGPLPDHPWLSRGWLRAYVDTRAHLVATLDDPAIDAAFDGTTVTRLRALHDDNARFLDALDALPRTICQLDLHPANLFATGATTTVIDWASVGIGAIGEDPGNLVPDAVFDFHVPPPRIDALFDTVAGGYEAGLRYAGFEPDFDVRAAMSLAMAAKYVWIGPSIARSLRDGREHVNGRPIAETLDAWLPTLQFVLDRADDARAAFGLD
jgi:hypothetical protein